MRQYFLLLLFALYWMSDPSLLTCALDDADDGAITNSSVDDKEKAVVPKSGDSIVEINPLYVEPVDPEANTEEDERPSTHDSATSNAAAKSVLEQTLGVSKVRATARFLKKHRFAIAAVAIVVAFRREILSVVWNAASQVDVDPETGQVSRRLRVDVNPTSVLKIVVFVFIMRQLQQGSRLSGFISPSTLLLLGRLTGHEGLALLLMGFLNPSNSAYVPPISQHYTFERLNDRYSKDAQAYSKVMGKSRRTSSRWNVEGGDATFSFRHDKEPVYESTMVVMDWTGLDTSVSRLDVLRDEVSFLIDCHEEQQDPSNIDKFEVVVLLESPGGSASDYALAAQQVIRMRDQGINVTICVDKIAASGGYMIACTSSPGRLFAAPFALLGSIGVIGQSININNVLKGWGVTPIIFRGGKDKAPVGLIGEVTQEGLDKVQLMVDDIHRAFKRHVAESRPLVATRIEDIATGDTWLGYDALDLGLVDRIITSDEYIGERIRGGTRVLKLYKLLRTRGFLSTTTSAVSTSFKAPDQTALGFLPSVLPIVSQLGSLLGRIEEAISGLLKDDFSSLTRAARVHRVSTGLKR